MSDSKLAKYHRLKARLARLEAELFDPLCGVCGRYTNIFCNEEAWTCPCHAVVCEDCWPGHEKEHHA